MHIRGSRILDTCGDISPFDFFQLKTESEDLYFLRFQTILLLAFQGPAVTPLPCAPPPSFTSTQTCPSTDWGWSAPRSYQSPSPTPPSQPKTRHIRTESNSFFSNLKKLRVGFLGKPKLNRRGIQTQIGQRCFLKACNR